MSNADQTPGDAASTDSAPADMVEREQLRMLFEHMIVGTLISTGFAVFLAAHLYGIIRAEQLVLWMVLKLAIAGPRIVQVVMFRRGSVENVRRWSVTTNTLLAVDGFVWGLGGMWFTQGPMVEAAVVAASLCCVACVATFGLQVSFKATSSYVIPMMVFTAIGMLGRGADFGIYSAAGLALVLILMLSTARRAERRLLEVFKLRALAQQIADERAKAVSVLKGHSEHKSRFIATISHEVRSPLHGIISLASLLSQQVTEPSARRKVDLIASSGKHLLTLVSDLLDMSKIEAGTLRLDPKAFDLSEELEQLATLYETRAQQARVHLRTRLAFPSPLRVVGDSGRVRQVLDNLVFNAIKFTPAGGSVSLTVTVSADGHVTFVVSDTGPGISKADQERLFRPFEQGSADPEKAREGAGLGLAIARDLVAFMQGTLSCQSELGHGATFRCVLPLSLAPLQQEAPSAVSDTFPSLGISGASPLALVVEDDEASALVATASLQRAGWEVDVLADGDVAVKRLTMPTSRPVLVLMDCDLPHLDGLEATRKVRAWEKRTGAKPVRIVALTGRSTRQERHECIQAGMDDVFTKPFSMAELASFATRHAVDADPSTGSALRRRRESKIPSVFGELDSPLGS